MNFKKLISISLAVVSLSFTTAFSMPQSKTEVITKTVEQGQLKEKSAEFEQEIKSEVDGILQVFKLKGVEYKYLMNFKKLISIILAVVSLNITTAFSMPQNKTEVISKTFEQGQLKEKSAEFEQEIKSEVDGKLQVFKLKEVEYIADEITNRKATVTGSVYYPLMTTYPTPPSTKQFDYVDKENNNSVVKANLNLQSVSAPKFEWLNDFSIDVEVTGYNASYFSFAEKLIPKTHEKPLLVGYERDYLKHLKLDTNSYKLLDSQWLGEEYEENGVIKRKARFTGERYVSNFTATYQSIVNLPNIRGYKAIATYEYEKPLPVVQETVNNNIDAPKEENNINKVIIAVSLAVILIILLIISCIFIVRRKKERK